MSDCIFCKIIEGQIPSLILERNDAALAMMDIGPVSDGHILVLPIKHSEDMREADATSLAAMMLLAQKMGRLAEARLGAAGYNVVVNTGRIAGQAVLHTHLHIIPRYAHDGLNFNHRSPAADELKTRVQDNYKKLCAQK